MFVVVFAPSAVAAAAKAREARGKKRREKREGWEKGKFLCVAFRSTSFQNLFVSLSSSLSNFFFFQNPLMGRVGGGLLCIYTLKYVQKGVIEGHTS